MERPNIHTDDDRLSSSQKEKPKGGSVFGTKITSKSRIKCLGLVLDKTLNFKEHTNVATEMPLKYFSILYAVHTVHVAVVHNRILTNSNSLKINALD